MGEKTRRLGVAPARMPDDGVGEPVIAAVPKANLGKSLDQLLADQGLLDEPTALEPAPQEPSPRNVTDVSTKAPGSFVVGKILVELIDPSPYQPRKEFDAEKLSLLADAIQASGLLNPILVRPSPSIPGRYELVGGERRWRAHKLLQWTEIEARIKEMSDAEAEVNALTDNEGDALSDFERARAFHKMLKRNEDWSMAALSRHVGVSKATITRCMSYFKLPQGVLEILEEQPRLIGTKSVAEFAAFDNAYEELVVEGVGMVANGKTSQAGALRWIKRQIQLRTNPVVVRPQHNHVVASGEVLGKIKVKGNSLEIVCEHGVNVTQLADLVKQLLSDQHIPKGLEDSEE